MSSSSNIEAIVAREGFYLFTGSGSSMWPLIRERIDTVEVRKVSVPLRVGDVILYRDGDRYVLHRVIRLGDDLLITRGDNNCASETVSTGQVTGVMAGLWRGEDKVSLASLKYRIYRALSIRFPRVFRSVKSAFWR